jgi:hypothetical protein
MGIGWWSTRTALGQHDDDGLACLSCQRWKKLPLRLIKPPKVPVSYPVTGVVPCLPRALNAYLVTLRGISVG